MVQRNTFPKLFSVVAAILFVVTYCVLLLAQGAPGATVTALNEKTGVVTAKVNSTGQVFEFTLANKSLISRLRTGQGFFVNLGKRQVSLDGKSASGTITMIAPLLRQKQTGGAANAGSSSPSGANSGTSSGSSTSSSGGGTTSQDSGTIYSAASLAAVTISPYMAAGSGASSCSQNYAASNSMLDVIVSGCEVFVGLQAVLPTQPDTSNPVAAPVGAGAPYRLAANTSHTVIVCRDKNVKMVDLGSCLKAAAYSSAALNRAVAANQQFSQQFWQYLLPRLQ